jgi:acyl-CoA reductase-like NAD-dependent aldehyde dehydrogenase
MPTAEAIVCRNPADAREIVAHYERHSAAEVAAACVRAHAAQAQWGATPGPGRGEVLYRAAELLAACAERLARLIVAEEGKLLADAQGEVGRAAAVLRFHAGEAERMGGEMADAAERSTLAFTRRRPLGVVGLITPWNFPIAIPAWKLAPALAAGNAVLIKPSSLAPGAVVGLVEVLHQAGVPQDALQVLLGGAEVGEALAEDPHVRAVSFTGSTAVGKHLARGMAARGARFQGELGGNSPLVVLADADTDVERVVELAAQGAFGAAGQKCTATRRLIVERPLYEPVLEGLARRAGAMVVGAGGRAGVEVPPLIDSAAADEVMESIEQARSLGAVLDSGGRRGEGELAHGSFVLPTVLHDVGPGMRVLDEEVFGPVCSVTPAANLDQAIELANAVPYGLSTAVFTNDLARAFAFIERCEAGMVHVNRATPGGDPHMPFGGLKDSTASGYREQGRAAAHFFTEEQTVYLHHGRV